MSTVAALLARQWTSCPSVFARPSISSVVLLQLVGTQIHFQCHGSLIKHSFQRCSKVAAKVMPLVADSEEIQTQPPPRPQLKEKDVPALFIRPRGHLLLTPKFPSLDIKDHAKIIASILKTPQV